MNLSELMNTAPGSAEASPSSRQPRRTRTRAACPTGDWTDPLPTSPITKAAADFERVGTDDAHRMPPEACDLV